MRLLYVIFFFVAFNTITDKKKSLLLSSFHLFPFPSILSHSVYFCLYICLIKWISVFDFKFSCMYANTVTHLILFFLMEMNGNPWDCLQGSREIKIESNPLFTVCCQYSTNCSVKAAIMVLYFAQ